MNGRVAAAACGSRACANTPSIQRRTCSRGSLGRADAAPEIVDELELTVGEDGDEERVLGREVAVEHLVREPRLAHDVAHLGVDVARAPHDDERGVDQPAGLGLVGLPPWRERPRRNLLGDPPRIGNDVLHTQNSIPTRRHALNHRPHERTGVTVAGVSRHAHATPKEAATRSEPA